LFHGDNIQEGWKSYKRGKIISVLRTKDGSPAALRPARDFLFSNSRMGTVTKESPERGSLLRLLDEKFGRRPEAVGAASLDRWRGFLRASAAQRLFFSPELHDHNPSSGFDPDANFFSQVSTLQIVA